MEQSEILVENKENPSQKFESQIKPCCLKTITELVQNNPMMACQHCENIIKRFEDDSSFRRYLKFCESRNREVTLSQYENYKMILFKKH